MQESIIQTQIIDRVGFITLNRPEKRNALNPNMVRELGRAFSELETKEEAKVIVLRAEGKAFCAGADLDYIQQLQNFSYEENLQDSQNLRALFQQIYEYPKVVIAQVEGHALAGGCGLMTVCDFTFAVPEALFGYTEVKIGFIPALVSVFLQEKIGTGKAGELLLSGEVFSAEKAFQYKLLTEVKEKDHIQSAVMEFSQLLVHNNSAFSMQETKKLLRSIGKAERDRSLDLAAQLNAKARAHEDCQRGIAAFLSKTKPAW
ncbi:enoyl-CoA hydratase/isomerase family protein [Algoriphagus mannitolivorans]|uniref:enoyl-CoA hydratase/isomerase family protein n=1 Tax=Algoriphagus mannitolivorans TaxID=226504 RepID=UPI00042705FB|nr:enoyl-CoA hydratase-related protein [Algoriphagus mannitolivorans]